MRKAIFLGAINKPINKPLSYGSNTSSLKPWRMKLDLILMMVHTSVPKWTNLLTLFESSSRNIQFKDIFPWNISEVITKNIQISTIMIKSCAMKRKTPFCIWRKVKTIAWSKFANGGKATEKLIPWSEEINKKKQKCENKSRKWVETFTIWVRLLEKNCNRVHKVYQFHQNVLKVTITRIFFFFFFEKMYFSKDFISLCFWWIDKFQSLWQHHRHHCILRVTLSIVSLES